MNPKIPGVYLLGGCVLVACGNKADSSDSGVVTGTASGIYAWSTTGTTVAFTLTLDWHAGVSDVPCDDRVEITIVDPLGMTAWDLGIVQTDLADGWLGEDCFAGPCHPIGITHTLERVTDCDQPAFDGNSVIPGATTWFGTEGEEGHTYLFVDPEGACFVFGHDPSYYASMGCTTML